MSTEMTPKEAFQRIESVIELADDSVNTNTATGRELEEAIIRINDNIKLVRQSLIELEELKSWRDELNETIQDLISKAKHWEEKENKTDFEKGIARGYKTMLHQLLVGIYSDEEMLK